MNRDCNIILQIFFILFLTFNLAILLKIWSTCRYFKQTETIDLHAQQFNEYILQFNKSYFGLEYKRRLQNFKASLAEIARLNALEDDTVFGLTKFSDMSAEEFVEKMFMKRVQKLCFNRDENCDRKPYMHHMPNLLSMKRYWDDLPIPDRVDWRQKGYVSPVQDQLRCAGCWAFSVVGVMETMAAKQKIARQPLSVQELLECSTYNKGCLGGNVAVALEFICNKKLGIVSADKYPLTLKNGNCSLPFGPAVSIKHFKYHCKLEEENILRLIAYHGPVTTVVNAVPWLNYVGGIIQRACIRNEFSYYHAVIIVGYDKRGGIPYYIVKNSWGPVFGDHGYVKVKMYGNVCGIAEEIAEIDVKMVYDTS